MSEDVAVTASTILNGTPNSHFREIKKEWIEPGTMGNQVGSTGGQMMTLSPPAGDGAGTAGSTPPEATSSASDISGDAEGVWSVDIDQAFQEALAIYPPCGRRKIIISDEGKMYGRNELIARYIKLRCGKTRTRKQVSSHIQVLARKKMRDEQAKKKNDLTGVPQVSSSHLPTSPPLNGIIPSVPSTAIPTPSSTSASVVTTPPKVTSNIPSLPQFQVPQTVIPKMEQVDHFSQSLLLSSFSPHLWPFPQTSGLPTQLPFGMDLSRLVSANQKQEIQIDQSRPIASSSLSLLGFSAYVQCNKTSQRTELVKIENTLEEETIAISLFYDKYPEILRELFEKNPKKDMYFLAKCWANINVSDDFMNYQYAVDSFYSSSENFHLKVSTMACSYGKQVVEKIEAYPPTENNGTYSFMLKNSPMCDYMVKFISELKKLEDIEDINDVLENFTVLQIVTNGETNELLMVICFVFEVSRESEPSCSVYRLES